MSARIQPTVRAGDHGVIGDAAIQTRPPTRVPGQPQQPAPARAEAQTPTPAQGKTSPDPMHPTDRYRLVTPFTLRL